MVSGRSLWREGAGRWVSVRAAVFVLMMSYNSSGQGQLPEDVTLLSSSAVHLYGAGQYLEAIKTAEKALQRARDVFGETHPTTTQSLETLALLYATQGRFA